MAAAAAVAATVGARDQAARLTTARQYTEARLLGVVDR